MGPIKNFYQVKIDRCSPPWENQFRIFICSKWLMGEWEIVAQNRPIELENCNWKGISHIGKIQGLVVVYIELPILWWVRLLARRLSLACAHRGVQILGSDGARRNSIGLNLCASARSAYTNVGPKLGPETCWIFSILFKKNFNKLRN